MNNFPLLFCSFLILASTNAISGAVDTLLNVNQAKSLCLANEKIVFSCELENKKMVSICLTANNGQFSAPRYRYGRTQKIELEYISSSRKNGNKLFLFEQKDGVNQLPSFDLFFSRGSFGYSLSIPPSNSINTYSESTLFINSTDWGDADSITHKCSSDSQDTEIKSEDKMSRRINSINEYKSYFPKATSKDYQKWLKKFGTKSYSP